MQSNEERTLGYMYLYIRSTFPLLFP